MSSNIKTTGEDLQLDSENFFDALSGEEEEREDSRKKAVGPQHEHPEATKRAESKPNLLQLFGKFMKPSEAVKANKEMTAILKSKYKDKEVTHLMMCGPATQSGQTEIEVVAMPANSSEQDWESLLNNDGKYFKKRTSSENIGADKVKPLQWSVKNKPHESNKVMQPSLYNEVRKDMQSKMVIV